MLGIDYYVRVTSYVDRQGSDCYIYVALGIFSSFLVSLCWWENSLQATNHMQVCCFSIVELQLACILPSLYVYDKETFFFYTITENLFSSLTPQDTLSQLDGFRDFVFVISSILRILVIGNYLPSMSVLTQWMERRKEKKTCWQNYTRSCIVLSSSNITALDAWWKIEFPTFALENKQISVMPGVQMDCRGCSPAVMNSSVVVFSISKSRFSILHNKPLLICSLLFLFI